MGDSPQCLCGAASTYFRFTSRYIPFKPRSDAGGSVWSNNSKSYFEYSEIQVDKYSRLTSSQISRSFPCPSSYFKSRRKNRNYPDPNGGKIHLHQGLPAVKTLDASLLIEEIQPEGKSPMSGKDFINGLKSGGKLFI